MIRNVILKKMIKNVVFPIITLLNKIVNTGHRTKRIKRYIE